jgi:hypothetical protein
MRHRLRAVSNPSFRLIRGERILPLVLAVSFNPSDNVYDYTYDGGTPGEVPGFIEYFLDGSDPFETQYVVYVDGGDPTTVDPNT